MNKLFRVNILSTYSLLYVVAHAGYIVTLPDLHFASEAGRILDEIEEARQLYDSLPRKKQKGFQDIFHSFAIEFIRSSKLGVVQQGSVA